MSRRKQPTTLSERFGFRDPQLSETGHDAIVAWLDDNAQSVVRQLLESRPTYRGRLLEGAEWQAKLHSAQQSADAYVKRKIEELRGRIAPYTRELETLSQWPGLEATTPPPAFRITSKQWEHAIRADNTRTTYVAGFVDLMIEIQFKEIELFLPELSDTKHLLPRWQVTNNASLCLYLEAKTQLPTLGELMRQINLYRQYASGIFALVCHDDRYRQRLVDQGVGFIQYPHPPTRASGQIGMF